jgi:peptide methionine sulfoxide reductase msrA/msrB
MKTLKILMLVAVGLAAAILLTVSRTGPSVPSGEDAAKASQSMNPSELKPTTDAQQETAILAGGCFWGMEEIIRNIPGVLETAVGYIGGATEAPSYKQVCTGATGHAEAVRIVFDPARLTYEALLGYFFRMHDPTTLNRQHNDIGTQYRSAIFFTSDQQKAVAAQVTDAMGKSGRFKKPIVTQIVPATEFFNAEDYHQKYLVKNPGGYNCHILRD